MAAFTKYDLAPEFQAYFKEVGIERPTSVQSKVVPQILEDKSVVCVAQTGTGKTLAYAIPLADLIKKNENPANSKSGSPVAIVLSPTRELSTQIYKVFKEISHHVKFRTRNLSGGTSKTKMSSVSKSEFEVLVSTPNRLLSSMRRKEIKFDNLLYFIFDEADQLFDMGFKRDIDNILKKIEFSQTNVNFFSATMPVDVELFIDEKFKKLKPVKITMGDSHKVQSKVDTFNIFISNNERNEMTKQFIKKTAVGRGIIFINQKNQAEDLYKFLKEAKEDFKIGLLHGDLTPAQRKKIHHDFSNKKFQILLATDIAARGIDIKDLNWVFNYSLPKSSIYYLHRSGRVARAGRKGIVYNLISSRDAGFIDKINEAIKSQSLMKIDFISKDMKEVRKKTSDKKKSHKKNTKRVKQTKRTTKYGTKTKK